MPPTLSADRSTGSPAAGPTTRGIGIPTTTDRLVRRDRLEARLADDERRPLTLVTGLPGAGKTTLVASWVRTGDRPAAWVSLDERHDAPGALLRTVVRALARVDAISDSSTRRRRSDATLLDVVTETLAPGSWVLVLDDVHQLRSSEALTALRSLLERVPPRLSRRPLLPGRPTRLPRPAAPRRPAGPDPQRRPRVHPRRGRRAARTLGPRPPARGRARAVGAHPGLGRRPATGRRCARPTRATPTRSCVSATATEAAVADYLLEEVLDRQDPDAQSFLLRTSIAERLTPDLAALLTADPDAAVRLDDLERSGVFLTNTIDDGWYRYHALFADLLRATLRRRHPDLVARDARAGGGVAHGQRPSGRRRATRPPRRRLGPGRAPRHRPVARRDARRRRPHPRSLERRARGRASRRRRRCRWSPLRRPAGAATATPPTCTADTSTRCSVPCPTGRRAPRAGCTATCSTSGSASRSAPTSGPAPQPPRSPAPTRSTRRPRRVRRLARLRGAEQAVDRGQFDIAVSTLDDLEQGPTDDWMALEAAAIAALVASAIGSPIEGVAPGGGRAGHRRHARRPPDRAPGGAPRRRAGAAPNGASAAPPLGHLDETHVPGAPASRLLHTIAGATRAGLAPAATTSAWLDSSTARHSLASQALIACGALEVIDPDRRVVGIGGAAERAVVRARQELARRAPDAARRAVERAIAQRPPVGARPHDHRVARRGRHRLRRGRRPRARHRPPRRRARPGGRHRRPGAAHRPRRGRRLAPRPPRASRSTAGSRSSCATSCSRAGPPGRRSRC